MPVQTVSTNNVPVSERLTLGLVGIHSELGVQVNNLLGIYFKPAFDIGFGDIGALNLTIALMADFTFLDDALTLGGGVDVGGVFGLDFSSDGIGGAVGGMYGGRLRAAWNAFVSSDAPDAGRDALTIGLDMRFLFGAVVAGKLSPGSASGSAGVDFFFSPQLTIGYTGF